MNNSSYFFKDKPLFGLDIGTSSVKVMQLECHNNSSQVLGYGSVSYDPVCMKDGIIQDHEQLAKSVQTLFNNHIIGEINTRRVAVSIPASRTFTRIMELPAMSDNELSQAVQLETEQYVPVPLDELYTDFTVISRSNKKIELLSVAAPRNLIDSHLSLIRILGLEPVAFDASILAEARLFQKQIDVHDIPTVLIDFGSTSTDITVHDKQVIVTGTLSGGGSELTDIISKKLEITKDEAHIVKTKYGIDKSKKQNEILDALQPKLNSLVKEIRRMIRYYEERSDSKGKIEQVITMGGGANIPGLSGYLTNILRIPVRTCNPWQNLHLGKLQGPSAVEKSTYTTAAGLALIKPGEIFS